MSARLYGSLEANSWFRSLEHERVETRAINSQLFEQ